MKKIKKSNAIAIIKKAGGIIKTQDALKKRIHPKTFYSMRDEGIIEQISRGVYRLTEFKAMTNPDLATVAMRAPNAVICLISALSFHNITTQIPHTVDIAIKRNSRAPKIDYPPVTVHQFSESHFEAGIETYNIDGAIVKIYSAEKTLADLFKFRNKVGMEIVLEGLKLYKTRKDFKLQKLLSFARICKVEKLIKPYLEALL